MGIQSVTLKAIQQLDTNNNGLSAAELQKVDTNKDGKISSQEASKAGFDTRDVAEINTRYKGKLEKADAIVFSSGEMRGLKFVAPLNTQFADIDRNNNQLMSHSELGKALGRVGYTENEYAAITSAYKNYDQLKALSQDTRILPALPAALNAKFPLDSYDERGISQADLEAFIGLTGKNDFTATGEVMGRFSFSMPNRFETTELFPNGLDSIRPDNIHQGELGDCYFLAAVASLANTPSGKQEIKDMIKPMGGDRYQVTFPGQKPVTIDAPTQAEKALYSSSEKDGQWLAVLEKAYAHHQNNNAWVVKYSNPYDKIGKGAFLSKGVGAFSTNWSDTDVLLTTRSSTLRSKLTSAFKEERIVTAGIMKSLNPFGDGRTDNGLPEAHAYSVLGYDSKSDMVTVRNPWGHTEVNNAKGRTRDGKNDGTFEMPLSEFKSTFHMISYEQ